MNRTLVLPFTLLVAACGVIHDQDADTGSEEASASSGGYHFGSTGGSSGSSGGSDDSGDAVDTDSGDAVDTEDTAPVVVDQTVEATLYIWPDATWEPTLGKTGYPTVCLFNTANVTEGDWTDYGDTTKCADSDSSHAAVTDTVTFTPGNVLATNAKWNDGTADRNFAAVGNDVNAQIQDWSDFGDTTDQVVAIEFADGSYDLYQIDSTGTSTGTGNAYFFASSWVGDDGVTYYGYDIYINTYGDDVGAFGG